MHAFRVPPEQLRYQQLKEQQPAIIPSRQQQQHHNLPSAPPMTDQYTQASTAQSEYVYVLYYAPDDKHCQLLLSLFPNVPKVKYENYRQLPKSITKSRSFAWFQGVPAMINIHDYSTWHGSQVFEELQSCMRHLVHFGNVVRTPWSSTQQTPPPPPHQQPVNAGHPPLMPVVSPPPPHSAAASAATVTPSRFANVADPVLRQQLEDEQRKRDDLLRGLNSAVSAPASMQIPSVVSSSSVASNSTNTMRTDTTMARQPMSERKKGADIIRDLPPPQTGSAANNSFNPATAAASAIPGSWNPNPPLPPAAPSTTPALQPAASPNQQQQLPPLTSLPVTTAGLPASSQLPAVAQPPLLQSLSPQPSHNQMPPIVSSQSLLVPLAFPSPQPQQLPQPQHASPPSPWPQNHAVVNAPDLTKRLDKFEKLLYDLSLRIPIAPQLSPIPKTHVVATPTLALPSASALPSDSALPMFTSAVDDNDILRRFEPASPVSTHTPTRGIHDETNESHNESEYSFTQQDIMSLNTESDHPDTNKNNGPSDLKPVAAAPTNVKTASKTDSIEQQLKATLQTPQQRDVAVSLFSSIANVNETADVMSVKSVPSEIFDQLNEYKRNASMTLVAPQSQVKLSKKKPKPTVTKVVDAQTIDKHQNAVDLTTKIPAKTTSTSLMAATSKKTTSKRKTSSGSTFIASGLGQTKSTRDKTKAQCSTGQ